ncbi:MAG: T9SS type A sorting domain-containing protein [Ginsengibacter sp.]
MQKTVLLVLLFFSFRGISQSKVAPELPATSNTGGGTAIITPDFIIDWSVGESTIIETYYGENSYPNSVVGFKWNVTSGILQPFDKNHIVFNPLIPFWTNEEIHFYPIPTPNIIYIDFRSVTTGKISVQLFSRDGKLLGIKEFNQNNSTSKQKWDLTNKAAGVYYFRILLSAPNGDILKQGTFNIEKL